MSGNVSFNMDNRRLSEIAKMAYGSGMMEGTSGGKGNIGILNGKVVKFNTHFGERGGKPTEAMSASCDKLRKELVAIAYEMLDIGNSGSAAHTNSRISDRVATFEAICKDLGMSKDGSKLEAKGLLDRKVVAQVLKKLGHDMDRNFFSGVSDSARELSSKGIDTSFLAVQNRVGGDIAQPQVAVAKEKPVVFYNGEFFNAGAANKQALHNHVDGMQLSDAGKTILKQMIDKSNVPISIAFLDQSAKLSQSMLLLNRLMLLDSLNDANEGHHAFLPSIANVGQDFNRLLGTDANFSEIRQALQGKPDALEFFRDLTFAQQIDRTMAYANLNETAKSRLAGFLPILNAGVERLDQKIETLVNATNGYIADAVAECNADKNDYNASISFVKLMQSRINTNEVNKMVDDALAVLENPAEGRKYSVKLTPQETDFMKTLVQRERAALLEAGKPVPSAEEFKKSVLEGKSAAFVATMLTFDRFSNDLEFFSKLANDNKSMNRIFSGAPENQRLDRAELFMTACNSLNAVSKTNLGSISILQMCEKLPEMRKLQPEGRLTCETIWKACFNEELPAELHGQEGTATFADAIGRRTDDVVTNTMKELAPALKDNKPALDRVFSFIPVGAFLINSSPTIKAMVMNVLQIVHNNGFMKNEVDIPDLKFQFNPSIHSLSELKLYPKDNAIGHSDENLKHQLGIDFARQKMVVNIDNGPGKEPTKIDLSKFKELDANSRTESVDKFVTDVDKFLGEASPAQRNVIFLGIAQSGMSPLASIFGQNGEHSDVNITLSRDSQNPNRILISYQTQDSMPLDVRYAFSVDADGTNAQHGKMTIQPFPPKVNPNVEG